MYTRENDAKTGCRLRHFVYIRRTVLSKSLLQRISVRNRKRGCVRVYFVFVCMCMCVYVCNYNGRKLTFDSMLLHCMSNV